MGSGQYRCLPRRQPQGTLPQMQRYIEPTPYFGPALRCPIRYGPKHYLVRYRASLARSVRYTFLFRCYNHSRLARETEKQETSRWPLQTRRLSQGSSGSMET